MGTWTYAADSVQVSRALRCFVIEVQYQLAPSTAVVDDLHPLLLARQSHGAVDAYDGHSSLGDHGRFESLPH
jgi:hypothetical protein